MFNKRVIALTGNDGSGKTYQAHKLLEQLRKDNIPAKLIHFDHFFLKIPQFASSNRLFSADGEKDQSVRLFKILRGNGAIGLLLPVASYIDLLAFYVFKIFFASEGVIILDRYFYDKLVKFYDLKVCHEKVFNLFLKITPRPTITLYLNVSPEIGFGRKKEMTISILNRRRALYKKIAADLHFVTINAAVSKEKVLTLILEKIKLYVP